MDWGWLVPVIILLIWIVNHVLRGNEEDRPANRAAGNARQKEGRTTRRPTSEIDRFLDEVNRRRRQAAERTQPPPPRQPAAAAPAKVATRPSRPQGGRAPAAPRAVRPALERAAERPPVVEAVVVEAVAEAAKAPSSPGAAFASQPAPSVSIASPSPAMDELAALLGSPYSLRTAVVLHEIFGPPRCRRHGLT